MSSRSRTGSGEGTGTPGAADGVGVTGAALPTAVRDPARAQPALTARAPGASPVDPSVNPGGPLRPDSGPPPPLSQTIDQPGSGLGFVISAAVALIVFALAIYASGTGTENPIPLAQTTTKLYWGLAAFAIAVAGFGAQYAERTASQAMPLGGRPRSATALTTAWIVPAIATLAAVLLVATFHNATMMAVGPLVAFLGNAGAMLARDLLDDAADYNQRAATTMHTLVIHAIAFLALSAVYMNKLATPLAALLVGLISGLLTLETLERGEADRRMRLLSATLAGWVMAQATIALNWWLTYNWTGGAVLLVCFYLTSGVLLARTRRSELQSRDLLEFGLVSLVAFLILAITA